MKQITECPFYIGKGKDRRRCPYKGKYKQFPNAGPDVPLICGIHRKLHERTNKNLNRMFAGVFKGVKA